MDFSTLERLSESELGSYLWARLRQEALDPPLDDRGGPEPPSRFVLAAVRSAMDPTFKPRVIRSLERVLQRASMEWMVREPAQVLADPKADSLLAGVGFMVAELPAPELRQKLVLAVTALFGESGTEAPTPGHGQLLRGLAHVQRRGELASFWRTLWDRLPRSYRALVLYGWSRADVHEALARIGDLVASVPEVHLPTAVWALLEEGGPGILDLGRAAAKEGSVVFGAVRDALLRAGADPAPGLRSVSTG